MIEEEKHATHAGRCGMVLTRREEQLRIREAESGGKERASSQQGNTAAAAGVIGTVVVWLQGCTASGLSHCVRACLHDVKLPTPNTVKQKFMPPHYM